MHEQDDELGNVYTEQNPQAIDDCILVNHQLNPKQIKKLLRSMISNLLEE